MVARMVRDHEVVGSNPVTPTKNTDSTFVLSVFFLGAVREMNDFDARQNLFTVAPATKGA